MNNIHESVFVILYEVVGMFSFKLNGKTVMVDGLSTMFWHNLLGNIEYSEWLSQCVTATLFMCPMVTSCVILLLYKILLKQELLVVVGSITWKSPCVCSANRALRIMDTKFRTQLQLQGVNGRWWIGKKLLNYWCTQKMLILGSRPTDLFRDETMHIGPCIVLFVEI